MAKGDITAQEYYEKYGYKRDQPGWHDLSDTDKDIIKDQRPFYQAPGAEETAATGEWWEKYQAGPDINIWKGLSEVLGIPAGAIKKFGLGKIGELMKRPDFAKEYGLRAEDLERDVSKAFAGRGLLDSSAMATAMGSGMSDLMQERAMMEENAWMNRLGKAGGFIGQGMDFAGFLNQQYLQDLGLGAEAIAYLSGERGKENTFNLQRYGVNPNLNDPITTAEGFLMGASGLGSIYGAITGGGGYGGGGGGGGQDGGGGGGGGYWDDTLDAPGNPDEELSWYD